MSILIDGVEFIEKSQIEMGDWRIIVADRGWVFAGECEDIEGGLVVIRKCQNIRNWGTKCGLGELINGPLANTAYDNYGTVTVTPIVSISVVGGWDVTAK